MQTNRLGVVDKHGRFMVTLCVTGKLMIKKYLNQALKTFQFMKTHPRLPKDLIPYWDMDAPNIPNEPRDASSASCIASALYEISTMDVPDANSYKNYADSIMASLASPNYLASLGKKMVTFY